MSSQQLLSILVILGLLAAVRIGAVAADPAEVPEDGGSLYANMSAEPQTLNPLTSRDVYASIVQNDVFETLLERDLDTLDFKGRLADSWTVSEDGLRITYHINPKARFSDGQPVTADDVIFTYNTLINPKIDAQRVATYFKDCGGIEKVDNLTVRFTWKKPYFKSLEVSGSFYPVLPRHVYAFKEPKEFNDINDKLVGSGPYLYDHWTVGQELVLTRNEKYWDKKPHIKRIIYRFILEEQASVQALLSGELDDLGLAPEWYLKLKDREGARKKLQLLRYSTPAGYRYIAWNNAKPMFKDRRVRQAMTHLIWREQLLKYLSHGIGRVVTGPFWTESPQYDKSVKPWQFDRNKALALLAEAGWKDHDGDGWLDRDGKRMSFELILPGGYQQYRDIGRVLKTEFRRVGIDMATRSIEWSVFVTRLDNRNYDAIMLGWTGSVEGDPFQIWHSSSIEKRGSNHVSFDSKEADTLIEQARVTFDPAKRNAIYNKFHRLLHREQPYTFMWTRDSLRAISKRVRGTKVHKMGMDRREWWIPKAEQAEQAEREGK